MAKLSADGSALVYSTYLGGSGGDVGAGIAVDAAGNAYVTGDTGSSRLPDRQRRAAGSRRARRQCLRGQVECGRLDAGLLHLPRRQRQPVSGDGAYGIAVDAAGNAYVTGATSSPDFPTANALQPTLRGPNNAPSWRS